MNRRVLVVRHAQAEEPAEAAREGRGEKERELTREGRRKMHEAARGLTTLIEHIDLLATSPLVRAVQTADILAEAFPGAKRITHPGLAPGVYHAALLQWAMRHKGTVAVIGHEPDLSQWIGYMVSGEPRSLVLMKKGSACCLDMPDTAMAGEACIAWHMGPKQLRGLAPGR
ncbi:MAG TPA: histidine phosphatase family protein [Gammaproteobacteria bacterium]|jgi:phosphohistidine phosphatase|nr:histidine phosphatase family protein [Gammaproteobacteria bacterium]